MGFGPQDAPAPRSLVGTPDDLWNRQYGQVPPVLAASNIPTVGAVTGGVAASAQCDMTNGNQGRVQVYPGSTPLAAGSVALNFPSTPPTLFLSGDEKLGTITQATVGNVVTISWTGAAMIPRQSQPYNIAFMWATSK